ncbi:MAG: tautomerase family protein [Syntrophomonadaceae bacterium]|nr:tautomerase family protein [Syntrophomonadaceae bacterium]
MPLVKVEIIKGKSREYKQALLDGIHAALVEAFRIPDYDRMQRLYELDGENFDTAPTRTEQFTLIEITAFEGRSPEAKKNLYSAIVRNLGQSPEINENDITVVIHEPPLENWSIRGGRPVNEIELGFEIKV